MKAALLAPLFVLLFTLCSKAQPSIQWQKSLGGTNDDWANSIQQTNDGGYIIAGYSTSNNGDVSNHHGDAFSYDYWVVKTNSTGNIEWQKSLGGSADDVARSIIQTGDNGFIVAGSSASDDGDPSGNGKGGNDYWIVKLSSAGSIQWQKNLGGSDDDDAFSIRQTFDGGYIVAGSSYSIDSNLTANYGGDDYWVVKLSSTGIIQWQKTIGGSDYDEGYDIRQTADSGYIIAGASASNDSDVTGNHGSYDYWIVKLNKSGTLMWQKSLGGTADDYAYSIQQTIEGGYIVSGYSSSTNGDITGNHGTADYWIVKLTNTGTIQWQKSMGGADDDESYSIQQTTDSGYIVAGYVYSNADDVTGNHGYYDYWIVKLNNAGTIQWQKCLGGTGNEFAHAVQQTSDGGYILAGWSSSNDSDVTGNHGQADFWIVKLNPVSTGVEENNGADVAELLVYPNPASSRLTLHTTFPSSTEPLTVKIKNLLGEDVLPAITFKPWEKEITTDVSGLASGLHFIEVSGQSKKWFGRFIKQ